MRNRQTTLLWMKDLIEHMARCQEQLQWTADGHAEAFLTDSMLVDLSECRRLCEQLRTRPHSTALVGTPETVAQALLDYHDLGVTTFLIRGYDPLDDAIDYGRELIPAVRAEVARRDAAALVAA